MDKQLIAQRIKEERARCNLRQDDVAKHMGWETSKHSIVVEVESGKREVKAWELYKLAQLFHIEVEDFFKPSINTATPLVLWREKPSKACILKERKFIQRCEDYKFLEAVLGEKLPARRALSHHRLDLQTANTGWANEIADILHEELNLGEFPASTLLKTLEVHYGLKFFALPLGKNSDGSAACTVFDFGAAILLNSDEAPSRQVFSIAHEIFHIITWNQDLFETVCSDPDLYKRNEQLANAFAAGLLMPEKSVRLQIRRLQEAGSISYSSLIAIARDYGVSVEALIYRLEYLGFIPQKLVEKILKDKSFWELNKKSLAKTNDHGIIGIGETFVRMAYLAYQFGKISRSRLARLLNISLASLERHLESYGLMEIENEEIKLSPS